MENDRVLKLKVYKNKVNFNPVRMDSKEFGTIEKQETMRYLFNEEIDNLIEKKKLFSDTFIVCFNTYISNILNKNIRDILDNLSIDIRGGYGYNYQIQYRQSEKRKVVKQAFDDGKISEIEYDAYFLPMIEFVKKYNISHDSFI